MILGAQYFTLINKPVTTELKEGYYIVIINGESIGRWRVFRTSDSEKDYARVDLDGNFL